MRLGGLAQDFSAAAEAWVKNGKHGELLGTFNYDSIYTHKQAIGEVYWINDLNLIGVRHADNSRMAVGAGWLAWRNKLTQDNYDRCLAEFKKKSGYREPLQLKAKGNSEDKKLVKWARSLWYHPESESYVEVKSDAEAHQVSKDCVEVTGDNHHESTFKRLQIERTKPKAGLILKSRTGQLALGRAAPPSAPASQAAPVAGLSLKSKAKPIEAFLPATKTNAKPRLNLKLKSKAKK